MSEDNRYEKQLEQWFRESDTAERYENKKDELADLFDSVTAFDVPGELIMERLQEGAAKRVPPDRLISVLRRDYERLKSVVNALEDTGYGRAKGSSSYKQNLKLLSIIIRGGVSLEVVTELLEQTHTLGGPLTVAVSACDAVFQVGKITTLSDKDLVRFGKTVLRSELPPSSYSSTASLFLKGKVSKLNDFEILTIIVRVLENNGGLIRIERELQRRTRSR